ncbi:hypothetical protein ACLQ2N_17415 [Streptomyces sp. DT224]|uniref:hypothetical protein n=1 Tax=Streptomyces sp. DT224 TaxID=3393426 RepID=UPI003CF44E3D
MPDTDPRQIPGWPLVDVLLAPEGTAAVNGAAVPVPAGQDPRAAALTRAAETAARLGRPVRTRLTDADGAEWLLAVSPDGTEAVLTAPQQRPRSRKEKRRAKAGPRAARGTPRATGTATAPPTAVTPTAPPTVVTPATGPADIRSRITAAVDALNWPEALRLCAELVHAATPVTADSALEIQARITGLSGDRETAYARFRDLADLRLAALGPTHPDTAAAAEAAQGQWAGLAPDRAARLGDDIFALRTRVPGPDGQAAGRARRHLLGLHARRAGGGRGAG